MSNRPPPTHKQYTDAIIDSLRGINPHNAEEGRIGYVYASGFLAAYLASLMREDPYVYKRFVRHIDRLNQRNTGTKE